MKIKKKIALLAGLTALAAGVLTACADAPHEHDYSDEWAYNAFSHWHPASCGHDAKTDKVDHVFTDVVTPPGETSSGYTTHICACGYAYTDGETRPVSGSATDTDWQFDDKNHWHAVLGSATPELQAHDYKTEVVSATCSSGGYTAHICKTCGYWYRDGLTAPTYSHDFDESVWEYNDGYHWHSSTCCDVAVGQKLEHRYVAATVDPTCTDGGYTVYTCEDCGYSYTADRKPASHSYSAAWTTNDFRHWHDPSCGHDNAPKKDEGMHILDKDGKCAVCGKTDITAQLEMVSDGAGGLKLVGLGTLSGGAITVPQAVDGKSITSIAPSAFEGTAITSLDIQADITEIPDRMCKNCTALTSITLPDTLETIGYEAFAGSAVTGSVELSAGIEKIGSSAFKNCAGLTGLTVACDADIPAYAFAGCTQLSSVSITGDVKNIGDLAFNGCVKLSSLALPAGLNSIGFSAFGGCTMYAPVLSTFTEEVTLGEYAFTGCGASTLTLSDKIVEMGAHAFSACSSLSTVVVNGPIVGDGAFENCAALTSATVNNATVIGAQAFKNCALLSSITLPSESNAADKRLIKVGEGAFDGIASAAVSTENNIKYVGGIVIGYTSDLIGEAVLKDGATGIADGAFRNCEKISAINFGSVRFIGANAFRKCKNLQTITITESVARIGANAFRESGVISVTIPETVLSVGDNAFYDCASLTSVTVNAKSIGRFAFSYTGVNRTLNNTVKQRPDYAKLTSVTLGASVEEIGSNAFQYCPITSVTLPAGLKTIGAYAFASTDIESVMVPASVTYIGEHAFFRSLIATALFEQKSGWSAGNTALNLTDSALSATLLKDTYRSYDWIRA